MRPWRRRQQLNRMSEETADGAGEAHLIALTCSHRSRRRARPAGPCDCWSDQHKHIECEIVDSISTETVRQTLEKTNSSPG